MAGRGRGKLKLSDEPSYPFHRAFDNTDPLAVYMKMWLKFPDKPDYIEKWIKDIFTDVLMNPHIAIDVSKYLFLLTKMEDRVIGTQVKKFFLKELESLYNGFLKTINDPVKYRNFTFFFAAALYFTREPHIPPLKELISALLILISKLDIMESVEDSVVYSKSLVWLSKLITNTMDGSLISDAYKEALNRLRELLVSGKGSLICIASLEASINGGVLTDAGREFYSKSLSKTDFSAVESNLSILIPLKDKHKYLLNNYKDIIFV